MEGWCPFIIFSVNIWYSDWEFCDAVYVEKKTLNRHVKTVHAGRHKINEENVDTAVNSLTNIKTEHPENEIHDPLAL